jgi:hypothetical protein
VPAAERGQRFCLRCAARRQLHPDDRQSGQPSGAVRQVERVREGHPSDARAGQKLLRRPVRERVADCGQWGRGRPRWRRRSATRRRGHDQSQGGVVSLAPPAACGNHSSSVVRPVGHQQRTPGRCTVGSVRSHGRRRFGHLPGLRRHGWFLPTGGCRLARVRKSGFGEQRRTGASGAQPRAARLVDAGPRHGTGSQAPCDANAEERPCERATGWKRCGRRGGKRPSGWTRYR